MGLAEKRIRDQKMINATIQGGVEVPYLRKTTRTTMDLLSDAVHEVINQFGVDPRVIDGLGVASFTFKPDRCIDLAWRHGLRLSWLMDDSNGGVSGLNMLQHAVAAIETRQANTILLVAGDAFQADDFQQMAQNYNRVTQEFLRPLEIANPNSLFALITQRHMAKHSLKRSDYGELVRYQRRHASKNPLAVYRDPMSAADYMNAPMVAGPLGIYDCVPVVAGANAILLTHSDQNGRYGDKYVCIRAIQSCHNFDNQLGDGLSTGLSIIADKLFEQSGVSRDNIDLISVYDDYPVMSLVQLEDLGLIGASQMVEFLRTTLASDRYYLNTSGGQLSVGQAGCAGGMHGLVEVVRQLRGDCGDRQLPDARVGLVSGYGMVEYKYGMCANATILEGCR